MKILHITILFFLVNLTAFSQEKSLIESILSDYAVQKVEYIQRFLYFSEEQVEQLKKMESQFLLDVQKAENCSLCLSQKRIKRLQLQREENLQKIIKSRAQFLRYEALQNDKLKIYPVQLEE